MRVFLCYSVNVIRRISISLWVLTIAAAMISLLIWPEHFKPEGIKAFLDKFHQEAITIYLIASILRGLSLLPSTPLIIAGTLAFPSHPWMVLCISIFGILVSSSMIYWLSDALGFSDYFQSHQPQKIVRIREKLEHPLGAFFVAAWAFFPLVPTDLVCYIAGSTQMNFLKFIVAIFIGELILCCIYIFGGGGILSLF